MNNSRILEENNNYRIYDDGKLENINTGRFLRGKVDNIGYLAYAINDLNGKRFYPYAHRLVAKYFIPNPNNLPVVNHINENRLDNRVENLEWVSYQDNYHKFLQNNGGHSFVSEYFDKNLPDEEWKRLRDFPRYVISSCGRIMNVKTKRIMKTDKARTYERAVLLDSNGKKKHAQVHRLVYSTFHDDYNLDGFVIDHIDANPLNNKLSNLQKITQSENTKRQARNQK